MNQRLNRLIKFGCQGNQKLGRGLQYSMITHLEVSIMIPEQIRIYIFRVWYSWHQCFSNSVTI